MNKAQWYNQNKTPKKQNKNVRYNIFITKTFNKLKRNWPKFDDSHRHVNNTLGWSCVFLVEDSLYSTAAAETDL